MNLQELISKQKTLLRPCETCITLPSGQVIKENVSSGTCHTVVGTKTGYIVDDKPDMQVAFILPELCMGSQDVVVSSVLQKHNITHILSLGVTPHVNEKAIDQLFVPLLDVPEANFDTALQQSIPFIKEAINKGGRVLVHCNAGVSRSASVVIAYLIRQGMTFDEAYDLVKSKREAIKPNAGFLQYLKNLKTGS